MKSALFVAVAICLGVSSASAAEGTGTADEAIAMTKKAVAYIKANGTEKAYAAITSKDPQFIDRDLYVFVQTLDGVTVAHGTNPKLAGKNMAEAVDTDGKPYVKERLELARTKASFWHDYRFTNPKTRKIEPKSTYCEKLDSSLVCVGIYK